MTNTIFVYKAKEDVIVLDMFHIKNFIIAYTIILI